MRLAHVRERHAPAGAPWRLAAALESPEPVHWLDLEVARRRAIRARPALEHDPVPYRPPLSALDAHMPAGLGVDAPGDVVDGFVRRAPDEEAVLDERALRFGPPIL